MALGSTLGFQGVTSIMGQMPRVQLVKIVDNQWTSYLYVSSVSFSTRNNFVCVCVVAKAAIWCFGEVDKRSVTGVGRQCQNPVIVSLCI